MPLDPEVAGQLTQLTLTGAQQGMRSLDVINANLVQGLGVINSAIIQAQGSVSDDSGLIAALQTAARSPEQGAISK